MTKISPILLDEQNTPEASKITKIKVSGILDFLRVFLQIKGSKSISHFVGFEGMSLIF